jgi:hypothetical protein
MIMGVNAFGMDWMITPSRWNGKIVSRDGRGGGHCKQRSKDHHPSSKGQLLRRESSNIPGKESNRVKPVWKWFLAKSKRTVGPGGGCRLQAKAVSPLRLCHRSPKHAGCIRRLGIGRWGEPEANPPSLRFHLRQGYGGQDGGRDGGRDGTTGPAFAPLRQDKGNVWARRSLTPPAVGSKGIKVKSCQK